VGLLAGCGASAPPPGPIAAQGIAWNQVDDYLYQLQNLNLTAVGKTKFDLVVMDYSSDGSQAEAYTAAQIAALKASPGGPKKVLAYMSIGEAENYRWYWRNSWTIKYNGQPGPGAPAWLGPENPAWPGDYKVKYWLPGWQKIIFGSPNSYLDKLLATDYDGVYLDVIDAFEYWGPGGPSGLNRAGAQQDMVNFVEAMAKYARVTKGQPNFGIFPQNGEALCAFPSYVQTTTGIGHEDVWYDGNTPNPPSVVNPLLVDLDVFKRAGKLVLVVDYVTQSALINDFYAKARARGYVPYATDRNLDKLTINPGHAPD
jgi:cysteinyl-tRNA synthetase